MLSTIDSKETTPSFRRSRVIFFAVMTVIAIFLVWPGYTLFSSATPLILGFPLSFAWVIFCTIAGFIALMLLYRSDHKNNNHE